MFNKTIYLKQPNPNNINILVTSISAPIPQSTGGARGVAHSILPLSDKYNYHFLLIGGKEVLSEAEKLLKEYKKYFCSLTLVLRREPRGSIFSKISYFNERLKLDLPFVQISFYTQEGVELAKKVIEENNINILEMHTTHVAFFKKFFPEIPSVLVSHNIECDMFLMNQNKKGIFNKLILNKIAKKSNRNAIDIELYNKLRIESQAFVTKEDMDRVSNVDKKILLPPSFDFNENIIKKEHDEFNVIWIGTFDWFANVEAMNWFVEKVYPNFLFLQKVYKAENIRFHIIGVNPPDFLKKLSSDKFKVYGFVEDLNEILSIADLSIAPIISGAGIKVKVVESISNHIPVLGTTKGVIGTGIENNISGYIEDDPYAFAKQIILASQNKKEGQKLAEQAFINGNDVFSTESVLSKKESIYKFLETK